MSPWVDVSPLGARAPAAQGAIEDLRSVALEARRRTGADLATIVLAAERAGQGPAVVHVAARRLGGAEEALAGRGDPLGLAETVRAGGGTVTWERVADEPAADGGLARLAADPTRGAGLARALAEAGATGVPLEPGVAGGVGAIVAVHLDGNDPPDHLGEILAELAPVALLASRVEGLRSRLARERAVLTALADCTGAAVIEWDGSGRVAGWRGPVEEVLGVDPVAALGREGALAATALAARLDDDGERRLAAGPAASEPEHVVTRDGRELRHERRVVEEPGGAARVLDIFQDVSRERRALAESARLAAEKASLAERSEERVGEVVALSRAAHAMASQMTRAEVYERLLAETLRLVGCDKAAVLELDPRGDLLPAATAGFSEQTVRKMIFRSGEGLAGTVVAEARPYVCEDIEREPGVSRRITDPEGIRSFLHVPIVLGERVYGLVSANSLRPDSFGEREQRVLVELARHAATALANARRYEHERHVAETLQRALLTAALPEVDGLSLAALYRPSEGSLVGGDFYSVWEIGPGRVGVLIGDVSGKGVEAAGLTAMIRSMAEALSRRGDDPGETLTELNELLFERMPDAAIVTVLMVVIDASRDTLRWTSAGHPPALLVSREHEVRSLDDPDPPCAAFPGTRYRTHVESFEPEDVLFAYTDGLMEARREGAWFDETGVRNALLESLAEPPGEIARAVHAAARAWASGRIDDDVAVAVVRRLPAIGEA